jgi:hypothetical protein
MTKVPLEVTSLHDKSIHAYSDNFIQSRFSMDDYDNFVFLNRTPFFRFGLLLFSQILMGIAHLPHPIPQATVLLMHMFLQKIYFVFIQNVNIQHYYRYLEDTGIEVLANHLESSPEAIQAACLHPLTDMNNFLLYNGFIYYNWVHSITYVIIIFVVKLYVIFVIFWSVVKSIPALYELLHFTKLQMNNSFAQRRFVRGSLNLINTYVLIFVFYVLISTCAYLLL